MSYSQADLDALRSALASGAMSVAAEGRTITYRSVADLERAIATVERSLAGAARVTHVQPVFERG